MPAYTRRWTRSSDKPNETTFECRAYDAEVVQPDLDMTEATSQLRHAHEQLAISARYPGRAIPRCAVRFACEC